jgi:hypothetical protein
MKVLFLDCDGVMLSFKFLRATGEWQSFDPDCVGILNHILDRTGAKIVVSSAWRIGRTVEQLEEIFVDNGVRPGHIIDRTEVLNDTRGSEIRKWIDEHHSINRLFIIDDDVSDIMGHFDKSVVIHTDGHNGLTTHEMNVILRAWC